MGGGNKGVLARGGVQGGSASEWWALHKRVHCMLLHARLVGLVSVQRGGVSHLCKSTAV